MAANSVYASTPLVGATAVLSTANTARDGTGSLGTAMMNVYTAPATGARIDTVVITATSTTTAGMVRLYEYDGTNTRLIREIQVQAITPSGTVQAWTSGPQSPVVSGPLILGNGCALRASTHNAESFHVVVVNGGAF